MYMFMSKKYTFALLTTDILGLLLYQLNFINIDGWINLMMVIGQVVCCSKGVG